MMFRTEWGEFPVPDAVDAALPSVPDQPRPDDPNFKAQAEQFVKWLEASPHHAIDYERLKRWRLVQTDSVKAALAAGRPVVITADGLE